MTPAGTVIPGSASQTLHRNADKPQVHAAAAVPVSDKGKQAHRIITTVHGTWARGAPWAQPGSAFTRALESNGQSAVQPFPWSGANSHEARLQAAEELAAAQEAQRYVLRQTGREAARPGETPSMERPAQVAVAHSHGGNVAHAANRILGPDMAFHEINAMGTPNMGVLDLRTRKREMVYADPASPTPVYNYSARLESGEPADMVQMPGAATLPGGVPQPDDLEYTAFQSLSELDHAENVPVQTGRRFMAPGAHSEVRDPAVADHIVARHNGRDAGPVVPRGDGEPGLLARAANAVRSLFGGTKDRD